MARFAASARRRVRAGRVRPRRAHHRRRRARSPAHRVWLPPLDDPPPLDTAALGAAFDDAPLDDRQLGATAEGLRAVVGVVDRPYQQRREPLEIDLAGAAGHVAVVGGPRAGKSTALVTLVAALAASRSPAAVGVHAIDLGGGALARLGGLPHVGTVADRGDPDLVRRTVAEVAALLTRRERLFRDAGMASVEEFRIRRAAGDFPDEPATDVVLVVDGCLALRTEFEDVETRLLPLAAQGLGYGVHLAVAAGRWSELRPALKELLGTRIELRLGEPGESEIDRRRAATVPARPGHCLAPDGAAAVVAAPWTSAHPDTDALVAAVAAAWPGRGCRRCGRCPHGSTSGHCPPRRPGGCDWGWTRTGWPSSSWTPRPSRT
ncbi:type VII secretion protein EccCb [Pseudonocardia benzenivorans]